MGFMLWKLKVVSHIGFNELVQPLQAIRTNLSISICNNIKIKDLEFFFFLLLLILSSHLLQLLNYSTLDSKLNSNNIKFKTVLNKL
jgi:membrane protein CcdC involved in cytochrome C biogenesis